jgi:hypothetical protein
LLTLLAIEMLLRFSPVGEWSLQAWNGFAAVCCKDACSEKTNTANEMIMKKRRGREEWMTAPSARGPGNATLTRQRSPDRPAAPELIVWYEGFGGLRNVGGRPTPAMNRNDDQSLSIIVRMRVLRMVNSALRPELAQNSRRAAWVAFNRGGSH